MSENRSLQLKIEELYTLVYELREKIQILTDNKPIIYSPTYSVKINIELWNTDEEYNNAYEPEDINAEVLQPPPIYKIPTSIYDIRPQHFVKVTQVTYGKKLFECKNNTNSYLQNTFVISYRDNIAISRIEDNYNNRYIKNKNENGLTWVSCISQIYAPESHVELNHNHLNLECYDPCDHVLCRYFIERL